MSWPCVAQCYSLKGVDSEKEEHKQGVQVLPTIPADSGAFMPKLRPITRHRAPLSSTRRLVLGRVPERSAVRVSKNPAVSQWRWLMRRKQDYNEDNSWRQTWPGQSILARVLFDASPCLRFQLGIVLDIVNLARSSKHILSILCGMKLATNDSELTLDTY